MYRSAANALAICRVTSRHHRSSRYPSTGSGTCAFGKIAVRLKRTRRGNDPWSWWLRSPQPARAGSATPEPPAPRPSPRQRPHQGERDGGARGLEPELNPLLEEQQSDGDEDGGGEQEPPVQLLLGGLQTPRAG